MEKVTITNVIEYAGDDHYHTKNDLSYLQAEIDGGVMVSRIWHMSKSHKLQIFQGSSIPIVLLNRIIENYQFDTMPVNNIGDAYTASNIL